VDHAAIGEVVAKRLNEVFDWAGLRVRELITMKYPPKTTIIDIGAGQGKYRVLLTEYENVDAVEVFEPYVEQNNLRALYRHVYVSDVVLWINDPDCGERITGAVIIMGDVLEHLTYGEAYQLLDRLGEYVNEIIVVVPYEYPQDEEDGNVHQRHLQDNLTVDNMRELYPQLTLMDVEMRDDKPFKGIYRWRR
jgi:hypothetical protein